jgi:hypothetical protein
VGSSTFRKRDLGRYTKVYPFVRHTPEWGYISDKSTIVETARILMDKTSTATYKFQENGYMTAPTVTATLVETAASDPEGANYSVFVTAVSRYETTIETSQNFTGEVHLQVMYVKEV